MRLTPGTGGFQFKATTDSIREFIAFDNTGLFAPVFEGMVENQDLLRHYDVIAGTEQCPVHVIQHRRREWFGVQFHPEIGVETKAGATDRHDDAVADGKSVLTEFVRYCLR